MITNHEAPHYAPPLQSSVSFFTLHPNATLSKFLTLSSSVNVGDRVIQPYKKRQIFSLGHTLIFMLSHVQRKTEDSERNCKSIPRT
jgi:hypothetical protein